MRYLSFTSDAPGAAPFLLIDGPPYDPFVVIDRNLGTDSWQHQRSGPRGTQGRRPASGTPDDRTVRIALRCVGDSMDDLASHMADLQAAADELRRFGGRMTFVMHNQSFRQHLRVLEGSFSLEDWGQLIDTRFESLPLISATCAPYVEGDPMDCDYPFDAVAELADFTAEEGSTGYLTVVGGELKPSLNLTARNRLLQTQRGYLYHDHMQVLGFTPGATITDYWAGLVAKTDAVGTTYLEAYVDDNGSNSRLRIDKVEAGSRTNLATANFDSRISAGADYWLMFEVNGVHLRARLFASDPLLLNVALVGNNAAGDALTHTLTGSDAVTFGAGVAGTSGFTWKPLATGAAIAEYRMRAYYGENSLHSRQVLRGVPGDAPALLSSTFANKATFQNQYFGMFSWSRKPATWNRCLNGSFENVYQLAAASVFGWITAGVSGITGAATSFQYGSGAGVSGWAPKYGLDAGVLVTPANANRGAAYPMYGDWRAGVTYTAEAWAFAPSSTTAVRIRLGVSGDVASSSPIALTTTYVKHTVAWTPSADATVAYIAIETIAATATTMVVDGVSVYEGTSAPTLTTQMEGRGAFPPIGYIWAAANISQVTSDWSVSGNYLTDPDTSGDLHAYWAEFPVDPNLILADDYTDNALEVEVWADIVLSDANGAATLEADAIVRGGAIQMSGAASREGSRVVSRASGSYAGLYRIGTVPLTLSDSERQQWNIRVAITIAAGTGGEETSLRAVFLAPARSTAKGQTGEESGYPIFLPSASNWSVVNGRVRTIRSDLSGLLGTNYYNGGPSAGLMGALPEIPVGDVEIHTLGGALPDSEQDNGFGTGAAPDVLRIPQFSVTPRWAKLRTAN